MNNFNKTEASIFPMQAIFPKDNVLIKEFRTRLKAQFEIKYN